MRGSVGKDPRLRAVRSGARAPWIAFVCWLIGAALVGFALPRLGSTYALFSASSTPAAATLSTLSGATSFYVTPLTRPINLGQFVKSTQVTAPNVMQIRNDSGRDIDLTITLVQDSAPKLSPYSLQYTSTLAYGQSTNVSVSGTTTQQTGTITGYFHITGLNGFLTLDVGITGRITNPSGHGQERAAPLNENDPGTQDPGTIVTIPAIEQPVGLPDPADPGSEPAAPVQDPTASLPTGEVPVLISDPDVPIALPSDQPETPATQPEPPVTRPEPPATQPETPVTQPEPPVTQPETPVPLPEPPATQPETPVTQPSVPGTQPEANAPQREAPRPRPGGVTPPKTTVPERETPLAP